jgi:transcriptional regulator of arginine metabolism
LSRDLRQLGAGRISDGRGGYYYSLPDNSLRNTGSAGKQQVLPVLTDIVEARGLLVIKTLPGSASSTAYFIDNASRYEIAGTIAGDDTILIIPRDGVSVAQVHTCLELLIPGLHLKIKNK